MTFECPRGVEIHGQMVRIAFMLNGKRCREPLRDMPVNEKTIAYAKSIREIVLEEIKRGVFDYAKRFPDSLRFRAKRPEVTQGKNLSPDQPSALADTALLPVAEPAVASDTASGLTVREGVRLWLQVAKTDKATTTYTNYACKAGHVERHFGDRLIQDITVQELKLFRNELVKPANGKKGLSPKTVNDIFTVVRGVWGDAEANELIEINRVDKIKNHKVKYKSQAFPFTREEITRLLTADPKRHREARVVVFNCWTGLSRSELLGLAREDVDLTHNRLRVRRAFVDGIYRIPKEEHREREIELIAPAAKLIRCIMEDTAAAPISQIEVVQRDNLSTEPEEVTLLFRDWRTGQEWDADELDEWFKQHLVKTKVAHRGINQCRHTFASQALSSHVTLEWLAKQLGHADTTMIKKHYAKLIPDDTKRMASQVSSQMGFGEDWDGV